MSANPFNGTSKVASSDFQMQMTSQLRKAVAIMSDNLVDRATIVEVVLLTALSKEHSVLLGPPGVAKSELARRLASVINLSIVDETRPTDGVGRIPGYAEFLFTSFTKPDEVLGPLDITALKDSRYSRQTEMYLPGISGQPRIAFLDEIFKANSAILNALLTLLNEGHYDNGTERVKPSWFSVIAASNELPGGANDDEDSAREAQVLGALYDRFLTRIWVSPLEEADDVLRYFQIISRGSEREQTEPPLHISDILKAYRLSQQAVCLPQAMQLYLLHLRNQWHSLNEAYTAAEMSGSKDKKHARRRIPPLVSDRRWGKIIKIMKVSAWYDGRDHVNAKDAFILPFVLPSIDDDASRMFEPTKEHTDLGYRDWTCINKKQLASLSQRLTDVMPSIKNLSQRELDRLQGELKNTESELQSSRDVVKALLKDDVEFMSTSWPAIASQTLDSGPDFIASARTESQQQELAKFDAECVQLCSQVAAVRDKIEALTGGGPGEATVEGNGDVKKAGDTNEQSGINLPGIGCLFVLLQASDAEGLGRGEWPGKNPKQPFYFSDAPIRWCTWTALRPSVHTFDPEHAVHGVGVNEINAFLESLRNWLTDNVEQFKRHTPTVRLMTPDEWRLAVYIAANGISYNDFIESEHLYQCVECADGVRKKRVGPRTDTFIQCDRPKMYSLFGNRPQLCLGDAQYYLVGGSKFQSLSECTSTLQAPEAVTPEEVRKAAFRVVIEM